MISFSQYKRIGTLDPDSQKATRNNSSNRRRHQFQNFHTTKNLQQSQSKGTQDVGLRAISKLFSRFGQ